MFVTHYLYTVNTPVLTASALFMLLNPIDDGIYILLFLKHVPIHALLSYTLCLCSNKCTTAAIARVHVCMCCPCVPAHVHSVCSWSGVVCSYDKVSVLDMHYYME